MAQVTKYVSDFDSSKVFDKEEDQLAFDAAKRHAAKIADFVARHYPITRAKAGPAGAIVAKGLAKWLAENPTDLG